jgi:hypothetical protein
LHQPLWKLKNLECARVDTRRSSSTADNWQISFPYSKDTMCVSLIVALSTAAITKSAIKPSMRYIYQKSIRQRREKR